MAIDVRSQIRELRDELTNKREIARFYQEELLPDERRILNESLMNYNAMEIGNFDLFTTKAEEARTEREYIGAAKDYWITRAQLERAVGGSLHPRQFAEGKSMPISNTQAARQEYPPGEPGKDYTPVIVSNGSTLPYKVVGGVKVF